MARPPIFIPMAVGAIMMLAATTFFNKIFIFFKLRKKISHTYMYLCSVK